MERRSKSKSEVPKEPESLLDEPYISRGTAKLPTATELQGWQPEGRGISFDEQPSPYNPKILHPRVLLCVPYFVCEILTDIHEKPAFLQPEYYDGLKQTAREEVQTYYDNVIKTIRPFKKKDGFDFAKEYRKWLAEFKKLFEYFLNQDLDVDSWREKGPREILQTPAVYKSHEYRLWRESESRIFHPEDCRRYFIRLSTEQMELHRKARKVYGLSADWTYAKGPLILATRLLPPRKRRKTVEEVRAEAEALVRDAGRWVPFEKMRKITGCSKGTLREAISHSQYLTDAEDEWKTQTHKMPRSTKSLSAEDVDKTIDRFALELRKEGAPDSARTFLEQIKNKTPIEREDQARDCKEQLRKKYTAHKRGNRQYTILNAIDPAE